MKKHDLDARMRDVRAGDPIRGADRRHGRMTDRRAETGPVRKHRDRRWHVRRGHFEATMMHICDTHKAFVYGEDNYGRREKSHQRRRKDPIGG